MATTLLILQSNPTTTPQLRLDNEVRLIKERLRLFDSSVIVKQHESLRPGDFTQLLMREPANLIHFCGHSTDQSELVVEDEWGNGLPLPVKALKDTFRLLRGSIRCVVLNSCYSRRQAKALKECIDCVVGTPNKISDAAATAFAGSFYQAIGFGKSVQEAFDLGYVDIELHGYEKQGIPQLHERTERAARRTRFSDPRPKIVAGFINDIPKKEGSEYLMLVKVDNLPAGVTRVVYEYIDDYEDTLEDYDDKFDIADSGRQEFESPCQFYGNVQIRATVWQGDTGFGLTSWLSTALTAFYGRTRDQRIMRAIKDIEDS